MDIANKSSIDKILEIHCRTPQVMYDIFNKPYDYLSNRGNDIYLYIKNPYDTWIKKRRVLSHNITKLQTYAHITMHLSPGKSTHYNVNSLAFRRTLLWKKLPPTVKEIQTFEEFKK